MSGYHLVITVKIPGIRAGTKLRQENKSQRGQARWESLDQALGTLSNHRDPANSRNQSRDETTVNEKDRLGRRH